jgi:hypothetical protein
MLAEKDAVPMLYFRIGKKVVGMVAPFAEAETGKLEDVIDEKFMSRYLKIKTPAKYETPSGEASVGKYAKTKREPVRAEKPAEVSEYEQFKDVDVSVKGIRAKTGEEITVRHNAKKALEKIDSDIEMLNKIVECL